jgi:Fe-S cluster assembly iron-binding protein IscA
MLQVTDNAASAFKGILDRDDVEGTAIRITMSPSEKPGGGEIALMAVQQPHVGDVETKATGVQVLVAAELADQLDDKVLDTQPDGTTFTIREQ